MHSFGAQFQMADNADKTPELEQRKLKLSDFVPEHWVTDRTRSSAWLTAYRMFRVAPADLESVKIVDLENVRLVFLRGSITYFDTSVGVIEFVTETELQLDASQFQQRTTPEGTYVLALAPYSIDGAPGSEPATRDHVREAVGLIGAHFGRNGAYQHLFDNILELGTDQISAFSPVVQNPNWFAPVDLSDLGISFLNSAGELITKLKAPEKNRVLLALRWFHYAQFDEDGVSGFIKYWVAIETLAMPNSSDIRPIEVALAKAYEISVAEAKKEFLVGRLFGFRSKIIHDGLMIPIHGQLLKYVEALFVDLFSNFVGVDSPKRAGAVVSDPEFNLSSYLSFKKK